MYRFIIILFLLITGEAGYAQGGNYLYIDADNNQTFYVKMEGQVHSSSQTGYILLSGLRENSYNLVIGFPKDIYPEQQFAISMNGDNQGFHLKNRKDTGWVLLNLKNGETILNNNPAKKVEDTAQVRKTDAFSVLLAKVVNDPLVLIATPQVKEAPVVRENTNEPVAVQQPEAVRPEVTKEAGDTAIAGAPLNQSSASAEAKTGIREGEVAKDSTIGQPLTIIPPAVQEPIQIERPQPVKKPAGILKLYDQQFEKVYEATYIDESEGRQDTIRISYPINQESAQKPASIDSISPSEPAGKETGRPEITTPPEQQPDIEQGKREADSTGEKSTGVILVNTDCKSFADDQDVDKLRVKILDERTADSKINAARKYFRTKCFTVRQIRALSELFPGDESKYRFFDTAYPFISDFGNFPALEEMLNEPYYKNRFKALIRH